MNTVTNPYDALYTNLKNRFTVVNGGKECSVADYMLMKAGKEKATSTLPAEIRRNNTSVSSVGAIISFMNERLTVKNPPVKDKTLKRFPIKSTFSAMLSAVAVCALVISCGIFASTKTENNTLPTTEVISRESDTENTPLILPYTENK